MLPIEVKGLKLDPAEARRIGEGLSAEYCFADPFPHIVLDNFLPAPLAAELRRHFPTESLRSDVVFEAGYAGVDWPVEHGGLGASPTEQLVYLEETARARAPYVGANFVGLLHAGPTL